MRKKIFRKKYWDHQLRTNNFGLVLWFMNHSSGKSMQTYKTWEIDGDRKEFVCRIRGYSYFRLPVWIGLKVLDWIFGIDKEVWNKYNPEYIWN